jgi:hypothetical protein
MHHLKQGTLALSLLAVVLVAAPAYGQEPKGDDNKNGLGLYLWATGIDGTMTVMGQSVPVDVSFDELFDQVDIAGSVHYERLASPWGLLADVTYIDMGSDFTEPSSNQPGTQSMEFILSEVAAVRRWTSAGDDLHFDLILGARYWSLDQNIAIAGNTVLDASESWVDGMVGGRVIVPMSAKWLFAGRLDVAVGGSDLSWNASALFDWRPTNLLSVFFGYRFLKEDYQTGTGASEFAFDADMSGPLLAIGFRW